MVFIMEWQKIADVQNEVKGTDIQIAYVVIYSENRRKKDIKEYTRLGSTLS